MKKKIIATLIILIVLMTGLPSFGHHALEYIRIESYFTAFKSQFIFHLHYDYMVDNKNDPSFDHYEFTPGISFGITERLMINAHTHFAKFGPGHLTPTHRGQFTQTGPSPFMEALALAMQYRLTENWLIDIAVAGILELPFNRSKELLDGKEAFAGILILSKTFANHMNICANFKYGKDGNDTISEWGIGIKTPLTQQSHSISAGIEVLGDINSGGVSIMPGIYIPLGAENMILKSGLEFGINQDILNLNVSFMYMF